MLTAKSLPLLAGDLEERNRRGDAGVVDQRADRRTESATAASAASTDTSSVMSQPTPTAWTPWPLGDVVGGVLGTGLVEIEDRDAPAGGGEGVGGGAANAAGGTGAGDDGG